MTLVKIRWVAIHQGRLGQRRHVIADEGLTFPVLQFDRLLFRCDRFDAPDQLVSRKPRVDLPFPCLFQTAYHSARWNSRAIASVQIKQTETEIDRAELIRTSKD